MAAPSTRRPVINAPGRGREAESSISPTEQICFKDLFYILFL